MQLPDDLPEQAPSDLPSFARGWGVDDRIKEVVAQRPEFDQLFNRPPQSPRRGEHNSEVGAVTPRSTSRYRSPPLQTSLGVDASSGQARSAPCSRHRSPASRVVSRSPVRIAASTDHPLRPPGAINTTTVPIPSETNEAVDQKIAQPGVAQAQTGGMDWNKAAHPAHTRSNKPKRGDSQVCGAICCCLVTVVLVAGGIYALVEYA